MAKHKNSPNPPEVPGIDTSNMSVGDLAAHGEQMAVERAKIKADRDDAMREAKEQLRLLKVVQDEFETRSSVVERYRSEEGPEIWEVHFLHNIHIPKLVTGIRMLKLRGSGSGLIPEGKRPRVYDVPDQRCIIVIPKAGVDAQGKVVPRPVHKFFYEGIERIVHAPMGG